MVERFASICVTCSHPTVLLASLLVRCADLSRCHSGLGTTALLRVVIVFTRRWVLQFLMGSMEVGSVVTWRRVPKSLMALKRRICRRVPKSLMGSPVAGSVVTWRGVPLSLMDLWGEGSVQGSWGNLRAVLFLFFPSCHPHSSMDVSCGHSQVRWEALRTVVVATRLLVGVMTMSMSITWRRSVRLTLQRQVGRCPQCPTYVVFVTVARRHVVAHRVEST